MASVALCHSRCKVSHSPLVILGIGRNDYIAQKSQSRSAHHYHALEGSNETAS